MPVFPDNPFDEVSIDFAHVDGETLLLLVDDYSRFPLVEPVSSTSASAVMPKLDQLFATFGIPRVVKSDNGPPFNGKEFAKFARVLGFKHRKVTPLWTRANGEVRENAKEMYQGCQSRREKLEKGAASNFAQLLHHASCNRWCRTCSVVVETPCS